MAAPAYLQAYAALRYWLVTSAASSPRPGQSLLPSPCTTPATTSPTGALAPSTPNLLRASGPGGGEGGREVLREKENVFVCELVMAMCAHPRRRDTLTLKLARSCTLSLTHSHAFLTHTRRRALLGPRALLAPHFQQRRQHHAVDLHFVLDRGRSGRPRRPAAEHAPHPFAPEPVWLGLAAIAGARFGARVRAGVPDGGLWR
jgi:hypothetical protein